MLVVSPVRVESHGWAGPVSCGHVLGHTSVCEARPEAYVRLSALETWPGRQEQHVSETHLEVRIHWALDDKVPLKDVVLQKTGNTPGACVFADSTAESRRWHNFPSVALTYAWARQAVEPTTKQLELSGKGVRCSWLFIVSHASETLSCLKHTLPPRPLQ